jgi:hypothetical protein
MDTARNISSNRDDIKSDPPHCVPTSLILKKMAERGFTAAEIAAVAEALAANKNDSQEKLLARRAADRARQRKLRDRHVMSRDKEKDEQNQQSCHVMSRDNSSIYVEEKEVTLNQVPVKSGARARRKTQIPIDLVCSERNISDAIKIGMAKAVIPIEWESFRDHHTHKGTLGADWDAGWRTWCRKHVQWNKPTSKPKSRDTAYAALDRIDAAANLYDQSQDRLALGSPASKTVPDDQQRNHGGNDRLNGSNIYPISRKPVEGDLQPIDRDAFQF